MRGRRGNGKVSAVITRCVCLSFGPRASAGPLASFSLSLDAAERARARQAREAASLSLGYGK